MYSQVGVVPHTYYQVGVAPHTYYQVGVAPHTYYQVVWLHISYTASSNKDLVVPCMPTEHS